MESWLENKDSLIDEDSFVYGALIVDITETGENEYKALLDWYTPYAESEEEDEAYPEKDGYNRTYLYSVEENFVFKYNRRGWWECNGSDFSNVSLKSVIYIPESTGEVASD